MPQPLEIRSASALGMQPTVRAKRGKQVSEKGLMVHDPMKRCRAENSIEAAKERKRNQVSSHQPDAILKIWLKLLLGVAHHVAGKIKANDSSARYLLQQKAGQFSGTTTRVQQALIPAQPELTQNALSPPKLRRREAVVFRGVPFARICCFRHPKTQEALIKYLRTSVPSVLFTLFVRT